MKREKTENKSKVRLIYNLKLKYDVIGRDIRRKTRILTLNSARNDPIDRQIKGSSFHDFEDEFWHSRTNSSLFSPQNLTFKHSLEAKIDLEEEKSKRFKDWDVYTVQLLETPKNALQHQRICIFIS